jgi:uncharacterized protein (TIGR00297 family)
VPHPAKAIPPNRDRLQSRLLVALVVPLLILWARKTLVGVLPFPYWWPPQWHLHFFEVLAVSAIFGAAALWIKAATPAAAACGAMICFLLTWETGYIVRSPLYSALAPLLALFILTFAATRIRHFQKNEHCVTECRKGRNAAQVIANLGVAAMLTCGWVREAGFNLGLTFDCVYLTAILAALAEATADTVSSEIGQTFGGAPILVTTLRPVPPGTDGAISLKGTLAGVLSAAIVVALGGPTINLTFGQCVIAFAAAICGLFFDTMLGATIERKGWLGNDLVNFASTAFAAAVAVMII